MDRRFPVKSWEFFQSVLDILSAAKLAQIWGPITRGQIYRWARNPALEGDCQPGPLVWMADLFRLLVEEGHKDLALAGLRLVAEPCGARVGMEHETPPADLLPHSAAADCQEALADVVRLMRDQADPKAVDHASNELVRTALVLSESYRRERGRGQPARWSRGMEAERARAGNFWRGRGKGRSLMRRLLGR